MVTNRATHHILPNISRSEENQTIKFGWLVQYNMRNILPEKSYTKYGGVSSPRPFSKKLKLNMSQDKRSEILNSLFLLHFQVKDYQKILQLRC